MTQTTGIFGGSFNPIHMGHIQLARQIMQQAGLDEVWFMVSPLNPFKKGSTDLIDDQQRLLMARRALAAEPGMVASDYEFHLPKPSYTWRTLQHLAQTYPDRQFALIIGADNWLAFDRWAEPDYILSHFPIIVYPRKGYAINGQLPPQVRLVNTELYPVSSTEIRRRAKAGEPFNDMVPKCIEPLVRAYYGR
jgi:nicotinate-nucleotide adenylyltransferase